MNSPVVLPGSTGRTAAPDIAIDFTIYPAAKVVFDGDSVTQGHNNAGGGSTDATFRWCAPFETSVTAAFTNAGKTGPTYANTAVGGNTSTECLAAVATPIAQAPGYIFLLIGVNDFTNHGGTPIPPATSGSNVAAYGAAVWAKYPGCRIFVVSNLQGATEHWPEGTNADDASIEATNAGIQAAISGLALMKWCQVRTTIFATDEPAQNPANAATGQLIQDNGGYHPTKTANPPATLSGAQVISSRMFNLVTLGT